MSVQVCLAYNPSIGRRDRALALVVSDNTTTVFCASVEEGLTELRKKDLSRFEKRALTKVTKDVSQLHNTWKDFFSGCGEQEEIQAVATLLAKGWKLKDGTWERHLRGGFVLCLMRFFECHTLKWRLFLYNKLLNSTVIDATRSEALCSAVELVSKWEAAFSYPPFDELTDQCNSGMIASVCYRMP